MAWAGKKIALAIPAEKRAEIMNLVRSGSTLGSAARASGFSLEQVCAVVNLHIVSRRSLIPENQ
jgi:hypothetical protein